MSGDFDYIFIGFIEIFLESFVYMTLASKNSVYYSIFDLDRFWHLTDDKSSLIGWNFYTSSVILNSSD